MGKFKLSILLMTLVVGYINAQEANETLSVQKTSAKTTDTIVHVPVSHWSFGIKGGINYFRVAPEPINRLDQIHLIVGGTLEYSINPLVGLGVEYMYNPYGRSYYTDATSTTTGKIKGETHDAILFGSLNLSNLLAPYRNGAFHNLNVYTDGGVGYAFYNGSKDGSPAGSSESPMAKVGVNVEYNVSKSLAFGVEGQFRYYHRQLVAGTKQEKSDALTTTIGLRYKFNSKEKKQHARNISMSEYIPKPAPVVIEKIVKDNTAEMLDRMKTLEAENAMLNDKIKKLSDDVLALSTKDHGDVNTSFQNIQFEFGSDKLATSSYPSLDKIADVLRYSHTSIKLSVVGYTDYIGTAKFNQVLSVKRANAVKVYLLAKSVPASSITIAGYGKENPIAPNETIEGRQRNRRVEFQITK